MTARQLAEKLSREVQVRRVERLGEPVPDETAPFGGLPHEEQQTWIDVAEAVLAVAGRRGDDADKLRELVLDWDRYTLTIKDPPWRDEMRRAVVIEMRHTVEKLWEQCQ